MAKHKIKKDGSELTTRVSRKKYLPVYLMIFILLVTIGIAKVTGNTVGKPVLTIIGVFTLFGIKITEVHRLRDKYEINPKCLIFTTGYFNKNSKRVDLMAISDIDIEQTLWQRILNYGDVNVRLYSNETKTSIKEINNPSEFAQFLEEKMQQVKKNAR